MRLILRILCTLRHLRVFMYLTLLVVVLLSCLDLTIPLVIRRWLEEVTALASAGAALGAAFPWVIFWIAGFILALYLARAVLHRVYYYVSHRFGWGGMCDMRMATFAHLQKLPPSFFEDRHTGELASRIITDIFDLEYLLAHQVPDLVIGGLKFAGMLAILFWLDWQLTLITMLPIPLFVLAVRRYQRRSSAAYRRLRRRQGDLSQVSQETLSGMSTVQSFTLEQKQADRFHSHNVHFHRRAMYTARIAGTFVPLVGMLVNCGEILVVLFGGLLAYYRQLTVPDLVVFLLYLRGFYATVQSLNAMIDPMQKALTGMARVFEIMDTKPGIEDGPDAAAPETFTPEVRLAGVSFSYSEDGDSPALRDVNLRIPAGRTVALVGPSGGGKTTIAKLICRFHDPGAGRVEIGGRDVRDLRLAWLRRNVSLVSQDVFLFSTSLRENIRYGDLDADDEQVEQAARMANAHEFIMNTEHQYDSQVGEQGVKLSGGQRQRISIARAILKNSPILILDEATSSVDVQSEAAIRDAITRVSRDKTTIIIAHRLSTVINADLIVVVADGRVVEQGRHDELLQRGGLYRSLVELQFA